MDEITVKPKAGILRAVRVRDVIACGNLRYSSDFPFWLQGRIVGVAANQIRYWNQDSFGKRTSDYALDGHWILCHPETKWLFSVTDEQLNEAFERI
jgi:hypothetical protein